MRSSTAGGGPSRRSHTKSRKGCKTCKRRHIRCDETFPQCRNCTKHQVRCDYQDDLAQHAELQSLGSNPLPSLPWTPEMEAALDHWERVAEASLGGTTISLTAQGHTYSRSDLQLLYFRLMHGNSDEVGVYSVWATTNQHVLDASTHRPYLVHSSLALSALALAWEFDSPETKSLAYHHGAMALRGLQHAIANYSYEESDALLLASLLLSWQANDWQSWVSLVSGIRTLVTNMRVAREQSAISQLINDMHSAIPEDFPTSLSSPRLDTVSPQAYQATLHQAYQALDQLSPYVVGRREEVWVDQIKEYLNRLLSAQPPSTPDEQFNYIYVFRKYLFWVPSMALKSQDKDMMTLIVLAHLYSTALQLELLFPDVAPAFCTRLAVAPLDKIIETFHVMQQQTDSATQQMATMTFLMNSPEAVLSAHRMRVDSNYSTPSIHSTPPPGFDIVSTELTYSFNSLGMAGQRSPAFGPAPSHHQPRQSSDLSSQGSPYLAVPGVQPDASRQAASMWPPSVTLGSTHSPEEEDQQGYTGAASDATYSIPGGSGYGSYPPSASPADRSNSHR